MEEEKINPEAITELSECYNRIKGTSTEIDKNFKVLEFNKSLSNIV